MYIYILFIWLCSLHPESHLPSVVTWPCEICTRNGISFSWTAFSFLPLNLSAFEFGTNLLNNPSVHLSGCCTVSLQIRNLDIITHCSQLTLTAHQTFDILKLNLRFQRYRARFRNGVLIKSNGWMAKSPFFLNLISVLRAFHHLHPALH